MFAKWDHQPINAANSKYVAWLPAGAPVPPPVIQEQAGLVVGDMKIITGQAINMVGVVPAPGVCASRCSMTGVGGSVC